MKSVGLEGLTVGIKLSAVTAEPVVKTFSGAGISGVVFSGTVGFPVKLFTSKGVGAVLVSLGVSK